MGSMAKPLEAEYIQRYGRDAWERHLKTIDSVWDEIRKKLFQMNLSWENVRVYQDGLPLCGKELEIAEKVASSNSKNYRLVMDLIKMGARLEGAENPEFLMEEYNYVKEITSIQDLKRKNELIRDLEKKSEEIIKKRDRFIAWRIDMTLKDRETGVLFIGLKHRTDEMLPRDISVEYLIHRLPFSEIRGG